MKITPEIMERIHVTKKGNLVDRITGAKYFYYDACKQCGEPYIGQINSKGHCSHECSRLSNEKMCNINGKNNPFYGKKHSKETKKKISEGNKGRTYSDETRMLWSFQRTGEKNAAWRGGCYKYMAYPSNWQTLRKKILKRDNNECQNPYCEHKSDIRCVHHIDYNKKNSDMNNLIVLCGICHPRTNFDREIHEDFYKNYMQNKLMAGDQTAKEINDDQK